MSKAQREILSGCTPEQRRFIVAVAEARQECTKDIDDAIRRMNAAEEQAEKQFLASKRQGACVS